MNSPGKNNSLSSISKELQKTKNNIEKEDEKEIAQEAMREIKKTCQELDDIRSEYFRELGRKGALSPKRKVGRRTKYHPKFAIIAKAFAALGLPEDNIAHLLETHPKTLPRWKKRHPEFATKIKEGRALRNTVLLQGMMKSVKDGSFAVQIFLAKNWLGMTDKIDTKHSGEIGIIYKSKIPKERGVNDVDPASIKSTKKKR